MSRTHFENSLGRHEEAKAEYAMGDAAQPARTPTLACSHVDVGPTEISLDFISTPLSTNIARPATPDYTFFVNTNLAAAYAQAGKMDEAKAALAEARHLNPAITVKWMIEHTPNLPVVFDGLL